MGTDGRVTKLLTLTVKVGGASRDRTGDLLHAMQALSQLSYGPAKGAVLYRPRVEFVKLQIPTCRQCQEGRKSIG